MLRLSIILLIALVLIPSVNAQEYTPPTDAQLWDWWNNLAPEEQIQQLRNLDLIEHSIPKIKIPEYSATLIDSGDLIISSISPLNIKIHYLEYDITMQDLYFKGFYKAPDPPIMEYIIFTGAGLLGGLLLGIILD